MNGLSDLVLSLLTPIGAVGATVMVIDADDVIMSVSASGSDRKMRKLVVPLTLDSPVASMQAWREQTAVFVSGRDDIEQQFPPNVHLDHSVTAVAALPIPQHDDSVGVLGVSFTGLQAFSGEICALLATVAHVIGHLIDITPMAERVSAPTPTITAARSDQTVIGNLVLDKQGREVRRDGELLPVPLTTLEFNLLTTLAEHLGQVLTKQQLLALVWDYEGYNNNVVEAVISSIRRKLGSDSAIIQTVRSHGYVIRRSTLAAVAAGPIDDTVSHRRTVIPPPTPSYMTKRPLLATE
jgi:DNA-binding winged helix-turn-helix (wHTH) protein